MFAEHYERLVVLDEEITIQDQRISRLYHANELFLIYEAKGSLSLFFIGIRLYVIGLKELIKLVKALLIMN